MMGFTSRFRSLYLTMQLLSIFVYGFQISRTEQEMTSPITKLNTNDPEMNLMSKCGSVCDYDDWFHRAKCDDRNLRVIPLSLGCEESQVLEVQNNDITLITSDLISGYSRMITFDLSFNEIDNIQPGTFETMKLLENIFLSRNQITESQNETFRGNEGLLRIFQDNNRIKKIHVNALRGLRNLKTLSLSENLITALPRKVFSDLNDLQYLHLSGNKISHLHSDIFTDLSNVKTISLDRNYLTALPNGLFNGVVSLHSLDFSNNRLDYILPPEDLGILQMLGSLYLNENLFNASDYVIPFLNISDILVLGGNPFRCDCKFTKVQEWFLSKSDEDHAHLMQRSSLGCRFGDQLLDVFEDLSSTCQDARGDDVLAPGDKPVDSSTQLTVLLHEEKLNGRNTLTSPQIKIDVVDLSKIPFASFMLLRKRSENTFTVALVILVIVVFLSAYVIAFSMFNMRKRNRQRGTKLKPGTELI